MVTVFKCMVLIMGLNVHFKKRGKSIKFKSITVYLEKWHILHYYFVSADTVVFFALTCVCVCMCVCVRVHVCVCVCVTCLMKILSCFVLFYFYFFW